MSADRNEEDYHLTPKGWVRGSLRVYDVEKHTVARPTNAVLTLTKEGYSSCGIDPEEVSWHEVWRSTKVGIRRINSLLKEHGDPLQNPGITPRSLHFASARH
jgi:hypothetical protein